MESSINHLYETMADLIDLWQTPPNKLTEMTHFKERIYNIDYTLILTGTNIMYPPATIKQLKSNNRNHVLKLVRNSNVPLE